jgi:hypothetical protein
VRREVPGLNWRDRHGESATCVRCLEVRDISELDRLFWCDDCRTRALTRAARWGWGAGTLVAGLLGGWIFLVLQPSRELILGGWIAIVVAAFYLAARIVREVVYGSLRFANRRAVEAVPPLDPPDGSDA